MSILKDKSDKKLLSLDHSPDNASNTAAIQLNRINIITSSLKAALAHGPKLGCPVSIKIIFLTISFIFY